MDKYIPEFFNQLYVYSSVSVPLIDTLEILKKRNTKKKIILFIVVMVQN